ncbi:toxic anion resistance family protein [Candidatus Magnetoovum chiemensis]|nr:toxic anion resistance family protein [Candidatus Magnetoovum chiemensis]
MRDMTLKLEKLIKLARLVDDKLSYKVEREIAPEDIQKTKFVNEELIFPLRQRIMDLQQQLAVNQQGVLAIEIIIRNNKELIRGVNRALNVTVSSLEVAVTVAMALANQRIVLDKIEAVNKTTSDLIAGTAHRLKTQGVAIQKQASSSQLNMDSLKAAFSDIYSAVEDIARYRTEALPRMAQIILEMDDMTAKAEENIKKMEKGNQVKPNFTIEWD